MKIVLGWISAALLVAGLAIGFAVPVNDGDYECGTAFKESGDLYTDELTDTMTGGDGLNDCDGKRSSAKTLPILLLILGAAGIGAAITLHQLEQRPRPGGGNAQPGPGSAPPSA